MTPLDLLAVVAVAAAAVVATVRRPLLVPAAFLAGTAVAVQAVLAVRWQLAGVYLAAAVLVLLATHDLVRGSDDRRRRWVPALVVPLAVLSLGAGLALPVFALDTPPGVGTTTWMLVDEERTHPSGAPGVPRSLPVQVWYPTDPDAEGPRNRVTNQPGEFARIAGQWIGLPPVVLGHLGLIKTAGIVDAPLPTEPLPVVVSVHGWGGFRQAQVQLLEQLAADGHLVVAIDHVYGAVVAEPVDGGDPIGIDVDLLPDDVPDREYQQASEDLERLFRDDVLALVADLVDGQQAPQEVRAVADLDRMVLIGHSTGGGAAIWACAELGPDRCGGVLGYDPWVEPLPDDVRRAGLQVPLVSLRSEAWLGNDNDAVLAEVHEASDDAVGLVVPGTLHRDVTVLTLLTPFAAQAGLSGQTDATVTHDLTAQVTAAFLADVLGTGSGDASLLDSPPDGVEPADPG